MSNIAGIITQTDRPGRLSKVTIDVKKHSAVRLPVLQQLGVIHQDTFEKEWAESIPVEQAREDCINFARDLWKK